MDVNGQVLRSLQQPSVGDPPANVGGVFVNGASLLYEIDIGRPIEPEPYLNQITLFRVEPGGSEPDGIAFVPHLRWVNAGRFAVPMAFGGRPVLFLGPDRFYWGFTEDYDIRVYDADGSLLRRIRRRWDPWPVTAADRQRYLDDGAGGVGPNVGDRMEFPEHHPAHGQIHAARTGHLWVERLRPEASDSGDAAEPPALMRWDVFDESGVWLGPVEVRPSFSILEIGDDYVAGVWRDEFDVEYVRVYDLVKSGN